jgi:predicted amidohydrolase YtcJ
MDAAWDLLAGPNGVRTGRHGPNIHAWEQPEALVRHLGRAQADIIGAGITTVVDAQVTRRELETYLRLRSTGGLRMRVGLLVLSSLLDEVLALGMVAPLGDDQLRFQGIKLYADGTLVGRTAWFPEGYASDPEEHGSLYHEPAELASLLGRAHAAGLQTATHALSAAAIEVVLDAIEAAQNGHPRPDARHRIEHCALPTDEEIERMRRLRVVPVAQSQHARLYGDGAIASAGEDIGGRYHPLGRYAALGVRFALSSDAPVAAPAPLEAVAAAIERRTVLGTRLGEPSFAVDVESAVRACTIDAAWATHRDDAVGSIEPGKLADFAILSADPRGRDPEGIRAIRVEETWIGGRVAQPLNA